MSEFELRREGRDAEYDDARGGQRRPGASWRASWAATAGGPLGGLLGGLAGDLLPGAATPRSRWS